jgi:NADPH:quinone reductase-like Zn-dependent oxidoreductase
MRSAVVTAFGGTESLAIVERPLADPGVGEVRLRVRSAAVNPVDIVTRAGRLSEAGLHGPAPIGLGWDASGTVDAVGPGTRRIRVGQPVIGLSDRLQSLVKTHADAVILPEPAVAAIPGDLDLDVAAALPLAGSTALQALDALDLPEGASLLVTGAAGAVGSLTVQLARLRGLRVLATARAKHEARLRELGSDVFLPITDRRADDVRRLVPGGVDGAVDAASLGIQSLDAVRNQGSHVSLVVTQRPPALRGIRSVSVAVQANWQHLTLLAALAATGSLQVSIAEVIPLEDVAKAHDLLEVGGLTGRIILRP